MLNACSFIHHVRKIFTTTMLMLGQINRRALFINIFNLVCCDLFMDNMNEITQSTNKQQRSTVQCKHYLKKKIFDLMSILKCSIIKFAYWKICLIYHKIIEEKWQNGIFSSSSKIELRSNGFSTFFFDFMIFSVREENSEK